MPAQAGIHDFPPKTHKFRPKNPLQKPFIPPLNPITDFAVSAF